MATDQGLLAATGKGLIDFLNYASNKHLMSGNTAGALRVASKEVLSAIEPEGWEELDLRTVDVEDFGSRFERARAGKLKPESMLVYKSRFRNAVQMYFEYLSSPGTWRYKAERPAAARRKATPSAAKVETTGTIESRMASAGKAMNVEYPFPLRSGQLVKLILPADLTRPEAKRLGAFIDSLAIEATLALPPAQTHGNGNGESKV